MAEAIGVTSGILTLVVVAYNTSKSLYDAVSSFKNQRKIIQDIQSDLSALTAVLTLIREQVRASPDSTKFEPLQQPLQCCRTTCQEMLDMLNQCRKHATDNHDSVRDWLALQYRGTNLDVLKQRLASYKSTLSITFAVINMYPMSLVPMYTDADTTSQDHTTAQDALTALKESIQGTKEDLEDQLDRVHSALATEGDAWRDALQADLAHLQTSLDSLAEAQQLADVARPEVVVERNRGEAQSRTLFGTDTSQPQFKLTVSDNEAGGGAVMGAGVLSREAIQALLGPSRAAEIVVAVQNLPSRSSGVSFSAGDVVQSQASGRYGHRSIEGASPTPASADLPSRLQEGPEENNRMYCVNTENDRN